MASATRLFRAHLAATHAARAAQAAHAPRRLELLWDRLCIRLKGAGEMISTALLCPL